MGSTRATGTPWRISRGDFTGATVARREFADFLLQRYDIDEELYACEVIFGELVTNAVRHAETEAIIFVSVVDGKPTLRVEQDGGTEQGMQAKPAPSDALSGRGLYIVKSLSPETTFESLDDGIAVSAVLPIDLDVQDASAQSTPKAKP